MQITRIPIPSFLIVVFPIIFSDYLLVLPLPFLSNPFPSLPSIPFSPCHFPFHSLHSCFPFPHPYRPPSHSALTYRDYLRCNNLEQEPSGCGGREGGEGKLRDTPESIIMRFLISLPANNQHYSCLFYFIILQLIFFYIFFFLVPSLSGGDRLATFSI